MKSPYEKSLLFREMQSKITHSSPEGNWRTGETLMCDRISHVREQEALDLPTLMHKYEEGRDGLQRGGRVDIALVSENAD